MTKTIFTHLRFSIILHRKVNMYHNNTKHEVIKSIKSINIFMKNDDDDDDDMVILVYLFH